MKPEVLIIGCGFLGNAAAELFSSRGARVLGLVRSMDSLSELDNRPFESLRCDVTETSSVEALQPRLEGVPLAIYAVSSRHGGAESYAAVYRDGLHRILQGWSPKRLIFVSSTSVYGQNDGSWLTEESPTCPDSQTGRILLEAERIAICYGGTVARLSGIYGPGRSVLLKKFLSGEAVLEDGGTRWINQIHRDDAAAALVRLGEETIDCGIYNVSDDTPATQRDVYDWIARFLSRPLPPNGPKDTNRKRFLTSKRISNKKLKTTGWSPAMPSYRDALPQLISGIEKPSPE